MKLKVAPQCESRPLSALEEIKLELPGPSRIKDHAQPVLSV